MYSVSAEPLASSAAQCRRWKTGNWTYRHFRQAGRRKSGLCLQPQQPTGQLINPQDFRTLLELTRGKRLWLPMKPISSFARRHRWLVAGGISAPGYFAHTVESFCSAGLRCGFTLANEEVINLLMK